MASPRTALGIATMGMSEAGGLIPLGQAVLGGGRLSQPGPPEAPPQPSAETAAVQQATAEAARRRSRARGARSTILSQQFLSPDAPALKPTFGS